SGVARGVAGAAHTDELGRLMIEVSEHVDDKPVDGRTRNLEREYRAIIEEILELRGADDRIAQFLRAIADPGPLADTIGYAPDVSFEDKVRALETLDVADRLQIVGDLQLARLERMGEQSGEASMIRTYLDWLIAVPWSKASDEKLDPKSAREVLDADHAGLDDVKDRITEYLAVKKLRTERGIKEDKRSGAILTLIGPPGTGKTSIGESIARATGREFVRMSLGGVRDEAEIRGHRRTYIGALPGR